MILQKTLQDLADMTDMILEGVREDENVILVNKHKLGNHVSEYVVDKIILLHGLVFGQIARKEEWC